MTRTTRYLLLMFLAILVGMYFYTTCCSECGASEIEEPPKKAVVHATPEPTSYLFAFSDGNYASNENNNYYINASSYAILIPLDTSTETGIRSLKSFLSENTGKVMNITGYYKSDETNDSAFPNLGLACANAVKNHLVSNGISSASMNTMGKLMDDMVPDEEIYLGPIAYNISGKSETVGQELKALCENFKVNPLVLYFDSANASINLLTEQRQKVTDISRYLDKVEGTTVNIVGQIDNMVIAATNTKIGLNKANFGKAYFMRNGIPDAKINTSSKGQIDPVESNTSEEGRTVVTLN
ncbi:OmpA family protein [Maribacter antarcticus]|uniref:OmpA family protein n=1 Tax=Maribacter antarcticus TaxID=505250 RepID=UPI00047B6180|nr:OmpA family protein [Maribacter antarcticus]